MLTGKVPETFNTIWNYLLNAFFKIWECDLSDTTLSSHQAAPLFGWKSAQRLNSHTTILGWNAPMPIFVTFQLRFQIFPLLETKNMDKSGWILCVSFMSLMKYFLINQSKALYYHIEYMRSVVKTWLYFIDHYLKVFVVHSKILFWGITTKVDIKPTLHYPMLFCSYKIDVIWR